MAQDCARIALERHRDGRHTDPGNLYQRTVYDARDGYKREWRKLNHPRVPIRDECREEGNYKASSHPVVPDTVDTRAMDVAEAVGKLRPKQRAVVEAVFFRGLTQQEAAAELGVTQSAVARLVKRAAVVLRGSLASYGEPT